MKYIRAFVYAVMAGIFIAIGGTVFLSVENRFLGSFLFAVGLFAVCTMGLNLFTGKVCYVFENKPIYVVSLVVIWLGNFAGTWLVARLLRFTRLGTALSARAAEICLTKLSDGVLSIFILAIFCNILICLAVEGYKKIGDGTGKYLAVIFGIMVFILCGFEHCVANMYYFSVADVWDGSVPVLAAQGVQTGNPFLYILVMTLGNSVGGVIIPLFNKFKEKETISA